jgi:TonB family protein
MERPLNTKPRLFAISRFILVCIGTSLLIYYHVAISVGFTDRIKHDRQMAFDDSIQSSIRKRISDSVKMAELAALMAKQKRMQDSLAHADSVNKGLLKGKQWQRRLTNLGMIYQYVDIMPGFPGGDDACKNFIRDNLRYPLEARNNEIEGEVLVYFIVETDGSLSDVQVKQGNGIGYGCDEEAVRIIKSMPRWIPGKDHGQNVRVEFYKSVKFRL